MITLLHVTHSESSVSDSNHLGLNYFSTILCAGQELHEFEEDLHEFQEHYSEVVRNQASVTLKITKCTTIGPPRIGKTCLKHYLTGQEWDVEAGTASTDVMEAPEWVECYSLEEGGAEKPWKLLSAEQQQGELIRAVNALTTTNTELTTTSSDASSTTTPSDVQHPTTPSDGLPTITPSDAPPTATSSDAQYPTTPSDVPPTTTLTDTHFRTTPSSAPPPSTKPEAAQKPATVRQALEALAGTCSREALQEFLKDKEGRVLGETHLVHFIDTGGQAIYHDIHPVLITSPSVYLVVFSLEDFYRTGDKEKLDYFRSDLIQRPLRSIYTFGMKTPQDKAHLELHPETPKILIVGTHLDQIPLGNSDMEGFLDAVSKMIEQEIDNKPYRKFVQYDTKDRSFWAVDNTQAGKKQDEDVKKYSTALRMMVLEGSTEMSVKVPVSWLLLQLVMEGQGVRYCTYSELLQEARIRGYVSEQSATTDLDTMLRLFHILGLFYHKVPKGYKKEDSLVFINPDCLYSATSDFLMAVKEEVEDNQGCSEEGQHQTQAANMEETEESQGSSEEGQSPTKAATKEKTKHNQGGSEEGQHPTKAATIEETGDSQGGSEEGQHPTKAATKEETGDIRGGSEEDQHPTKAGTTEECYDETVTGNESKQQKQEPKGIVQKTRVIERIQRNFGHIQHEMEAVLQKVEKAMTQEAIEAVLESLHDQLKKIEQRYKLHPGEFQDALSVKAKQQLFIGTLVHSLASSVKAVLRDSERKEVAKAVKNVRAHYQSRSINSRDMDQFFAILSDLRIVAELGDSEGYVVPAALPKRKVPHTVEIAGQFEADPILVTVVSQTTMQVCYLPSGLFCCLISELVTKADWTVHPHGRTHVAFTHKDLSGRVHITECKSYIKINMESHASLQEPSEAFQFQNVRKKIHNSIVQVYENLYSDPTAATTFEESLQWGFQCEDHPDDDTHIAAYEEDEYECCAKCLIQSHVIQAVKPEQVVWFGSE